MSRNTKGISIRTRIAIGTLIVVLLTWSTLAGLSYVTSSTLINTTSRQLFESAADEISTEIQGAYQPLLKNTLLLTDSRLVNTTTLEERLQSLGLLVDVLQQSPEATAILAGYQNGDHFMVRNLTTKRLRDALKAPEEADYAVDHFYGDRRVEPVRLFYNASMELESEVALTDSTFDPRTRPWFIAAQQSDDPITTVPYLFFSSHDIGITIATSTPDHKAVMAIDVTLATVSRYLNRQRITDNTELVLRNDDGLIAWSSNSSLIVEEGNIRQRRLEDVNHPPYRALSAGLEHEDWLIYRENIPLLLSGDVELVIAVPKREYLSELGTIRNRILLASFLLLTLLVPLAWWMANRISRPIRELHDAISEVNRETFSLQLPPARGRDEVHALNHALRDMSDTLQLHIADLKAATAARQKFESEMDIARRIQMDFVPGNGELSTTLGTDPLYACLKPAKAVGGDLYQLIELKDGRYFIAIGDVSDKGAPAALYMSKTAGLIRMLAPGATSAGSFLAQLNNELSLDNDSCMFVTLFCGYYHAESGELQYATAGHNPPLRLQNHQAECLPVESGVPLGIFEGGEYMDQSLTLEPGMELCLYTDGITEAFDPQRHEFSEERLIETVRALDMEIPVKAHGEAILEAVQQFAAGSDQSDDITLVILRRCIRD